MDTAQITRAIHFSEQAIARTVISEGLSVRLQRVIHGPLTLTFQLQLTQPTKRDLERLLSLGPTLAQALAVPAVRVGNGVGSIYIEIPLPPHLCRTPTGGDLAAHTNGLNVAIGLDSLRRPQTVDLSQHGAVVWVGPSRRGKTQSMRSSLYALLRKNPSQVGFMVLSQKVMDWTDFSSAAGCLGIVTADNAGIALEWAASTMAKRAKSGKRGQPLIVIADDLLNLLSLDPALAAPLGDMSSQGAGLGIHVWVGTQDAGSKRGTGGTAIENNATARLVYKPSNRTAGARATGGTLENVESLGTSRGDAIYILDGNSQRVATGWVQPQAVGQLPQGPYSAPWAKARTRTDPPPDRAYVTPSDRGGRPEPAIEPARKPVQTVLAPSVEPAARQSEPAIEPAARQSEPAAELPQGARVMGYKLPGNRPPDAGERAYIRYVASISPSLSQACKTCYGYKNGVVMEYCKQAISTGDKTR